MNEATVTPFGCVPFVMRKLLLVKQPVDQIVMDKFDRNRSRRAADVTINEQDGCDSDGMCEAQRAGFPARARFGFTPIEDTIIDLLRRMCQLYASGDGRHWDAAVEHAENQFGTRLGPDLVARVTSVMRALRKERSSPFSFLTFGCQQICDDELAVISLVKSARLGCPPGFKEALRYANKGESTDRLEQAVRALARLHDEIEGKWHDSQSTGRAAGLPSGQRLH